VRYSLTEKWENCTILEPAISMIEIRLGHADKTAFSACRGRQSGWNVGRSASSNRNAKNLGKFFYAERADGNQETLQETSCILSLPFMDS
jgi:hypothetical protein